MVPRRDFLKTAAGAMGAALAVPASLERFQQSSGPLQGLRPMLDGVERISDSERLARMERARVLMVEKGIDAIIVEPGSTLFYFTGVRWWASERLFALIVPARGPLAWICPRFEEDRARELIHSGDDVRCWEEDENPYRLVTGVLRDRGLRAGRIGIEERVRFFVFDGIRKEVSGCEWVCADPVSVACRIVKSPAEIALMQRANEITLVALRTASVMAREGMTPAEFSANCSAAFRALGVSGAVGVNFGAATASPHGSSRPQNLHEGDVIMMDGGCSVDGYQADVTRSIVFGEPTRRQRDVWDLVRRAQDAALAAAHVGVACEDVDAAARTVIVSAGFGPGYRLPGFPHRTGHGIGLDGHEWTYLVRGNRTPLRPGMCFSNEPMVAIPGEFGIRHEDCMVIGEEKGRLFTGPSRSIDDPFG